MIFVDLVDLCIGNRPSWRGQLPLVPLCKTINRKYVKHKADGRGLMIFVVSSIYIYSTVASEGFSLEFLFQFLSVTYAV
jgi:hypothetical protein